MRLFNLTMLHGKTGTTKPGPVETVMIISNTSWYLYNFRSKLIDELRCCGHEIIAVAPYDEYSGRLRNARYVELPMNNQGINPWQDSLLILRLLGLFIKYRPNVILSYTPKCNIYAALIAGLLNIPIVNNVSGLGTAFIWDNWVTRLVKLLYRVSLRRSRKVFFQNDDDMHLFVDGGMVKRSQVERLPGSGVDLQRFSPAQVQHKNDGFVFLCVARMLKDKGIVELVEAVRLLKPQYPNLRCQLLGFLDVKNTSAIAKEEMQTWVDEGLVEYLGVSDEVVEYLRRCDCVVLPSYREGTPRSLLEAASVGKPIITTDAVGCREVVDDGVNGYLCQVKSVVDLKDKMEKMLCLSESELLRMGLQGREKMQREFDETIVIDRYRELVSQILTQIIH